MATKSKIASYDGEHLTAVFAIVGYSIKTMEGNHLVIQFCFEAHCKKSLVEIEICKNFIADIVAMLVENLEFVEASLVRYCVETFDSFIP